ncbi:MAG: cytochrome P450 [Actinomycetales bacterium]|nr:cytochrome P450 [Actinomycetales bacterium]
MSSITQQPTTAPDYHGFEPFKLTDPFGAYEELRDEAPVMFDDRIGYFVVSRYADIKATFDNWESFSSANAQAPVKPLCAAAKKVMDDGGFTTYSGLSARVPPEHTRIRAVATKAFTPRRYKVLEPFIRENMNVLLDAMIAKGSPGDILTDVAYDLPTITIFKLIGVPNEMIDQVKDWAGSRTALTWGDLTDDEQIPHAHNMVNYWNFCQSLVAASKVTPGDNLVTDLVNLQAAGDEITDHEIASFLYSLLFAGHETTTTLVSNAVRVLLENPASYAAITEDPSKIGGAIDEVLRVSGSIFAWRRTAVVDAEIGDVAIPQGSNVLLLMGSANRDPSVFPAPDTFDIGRENARNHLSFGYGIHYCIGNLLGKLQTRVALEEITKRLPQLQLAPGAPITFGDNLSFRVPTAVPVQWNN